MQQLVLCTFYIVYLASFATRLGLPQVLKYLPELLSGVMLVYVVFVGTKRRFDLVAPKYWLTFGALVLVILCGLASNGISSGPLIGELRFYVRAMPLFFVPAIYDFSEAELRQQLRVLLYLALLQLPVAVMQRWIVLSQDRFSGDAVQGTLGDSGVLSIVLICSALVLTGLFLRRRLSKLRYGVLLALLLLPTTINETKVTLLLVPVGVLIVMIVGAEVGRRLHIAVVASSVILFFLAAYVPIYSMMEMHNPDKKESGILDFFGNNKKISGYMSSNISGLGTKKDVRRGDAIMVPFKYLAQDPVRLSLGLGLGSVAPSNMGPSFEGPYRGLFGQFTLMSIIFFMLEMGLVGCSLVLLLYYLLFRDALFVANNDTDIHGALAVGWTGVVALMFVAIFYDPAHQFESLSYLFWYFSGVIAARAARDSSRNRNVNIKTNRTLPLAQPIRPKSSP
jgi:hypothetical protein